MFTIYAHVKTDGQTIYNGDVVILYYGYGGKYVPIPNRNNTSLDFCPGVDPPAYLTYGICSENVFRIYIKL